MLVTCLAGNSHATEKGSKDKTPSPARGVKSAVVLPAQRYVPAFTAVVNETYVTYRFVRDPRTGRIISVPVVLFRQIVVQVYYDRLTNVYFYLDNFGQPAPYLGPRPG
ncbi:MAG: hypothetical protein K2X93_13070 [Candidatus Obscuribacterales bacterium]|nr:hypothetical protein [Candidatus Obscuribacterales bacterium]